jgi:DNA-directed RNA polymerase specialized sigma24 family protein
VAGLYRTHYHSLVRIAALLIGDTVAAEDIVQAAFVSLHREWPHLGDADTALVYLRRSVIRGTRFWERTSAGRPGQPGGAPHTSWPDHGTQETLLMAALSALPARQREALVLRYFAEWPDAQIAAAMGTSSRGVVSHIARGMSTLRACRILA